jgi:tRNA1Val (adenine37-N6)-methyltransferase
MKIGTDAILLGAWAAAMEPRQILDIGTGSGIIALMVAQRFPAANVIALEIDSAACAQACGNFAAAPFCNRLTLTRCAVQDFQPNVQFDLVVCNPPWFQRSLKPPNAARAMARHSDSLSLEELGAAASRLLSPGGVLNVILPIQQALTFTAIATEFQLHCLRLCAVRPTPTSTPKRQLLEFSNRPPEQDVCAQEIVIEVTRHQYSDEYSRLAKEFLLKL